MEVSGIGFSIAEEFIKNGSKVIIAGRNKDKLHRAAISLGGGMLRAIVIDVTNTSSFFEKVMQAAAMFEENRIDILVNSAGILAHSSFMDITEKEYDEIMNTNVRGTYFLSREVGKFMIEKGIKGHILNVTSSSALRPCWTPYQLSKWAVRGFTLGLAEMMQPYGITVNAIAPGPTATPMLGKQEGDSVYEERFPAKRYALPREIAALAVYLASPLGDMVVGDTMYVTGGSGNLDLHN